MKNFFKLLNIKLNKITNKGKTIRQEKDRSKEFYSMSLLAKMQRRSLIVNNYLGRYLNKIYNLFRAIFHCFSKLDRILIVLYFSSFLAIVYLLNLFSYLSEATIINALLLGLVGGSIIIIQVLVYRRIEQGLNKMRQNASRLRTLQEKTLACIQIDQLDEGMPLLSIIMPVFNVASYLDASILSILNQTYKNFELIIVNDASTDESLKVIDMYAKLDSRIKKINLNCNTLGGAGIPSNIGMKQAKGKYIGFLDSDDFIVGDAFEVLVRKAEESDAEVVIGDFKTFNHTSRDLILAYDKPKWRSLPVGKVFSVTEFPQVLRMSPVPWRKLYKREFLNENNITFPEVDSFYEDNPLHWFVLANAKRIVLIDKVLVYHRMSHDGQTMGAVNYKFIGIISHINTIITYFFEKKKDLPLSISHELLHFLFGAHWLIDRQEDEEIRNLMKKRYYQVFTRMKVIGISDKDIYTRMTFFRNRSLEYGAANNNIDLTIVIPVYNCAQFIEETLNKLTKFKAITAEVLLMDDGSDDGSKIICQKFCENHKNFHLFTQKNCGSGRARNALIPFCFGEYSYFLDADDTVELEALEEAVVVAKNGKHDMLLFKYVIDAYDESKTNKMFDADQKIWAALLETNSSADLARLALGLINYPWNRIIKSTLLHNANIFFGPTVVHNDIQFHWHSLLAAENLGIFNKEVCIHRKFTSRSQLTNINDARRLMLFEALYYTQRIISRHDTYSDIKSAWSDFAQNIINWAEKRVSVDLKERFYKDKIVFLDNL